MRSRAGLLVLALIGVPPPGSVLAQDEAEPSTDDGESAGGSDAEDPRRDRALALYAAARTLDAEGRTEEALPLAEEAYRIYPSGGSRYAMGLLHERLGHRDEAVRHYRMALAEPRPASPDLAQSIGASLVRLDAPTSPLEPEPLDGDEEPETLRRPGGALETPSAEAVADADADPEVTPAEEPEVAPPPPIRSGLRVGVSGFGDVAHLDTSWGFGAYVGWIFDVGAFVQLELTGPHFSALLAGGIEIGDFVLRPIVAAFVGLSPLRTFDGDPDVAVFLGPRLGLALHPFEELPLSFALTGALAVDVTRADDGFVFTVPVSLEARWVFD